MNKPAQTARHDFLLRQYNRLLKTGDGPDQARARLADALGEEALAELTRTDDKHEPTHADALIDIASDAGGDAGAARAALHAARDEARLIALDWWRPARTFLLYTLFLLALAIALVAFFSTTVLPVLDQFNQGMGVPGGGAAGMLTAHGAWRLLLPLLILAALIVLSGLLFRRFRQCVASLTDLPGNHIVQAILGHSSRSFRRLLALELADVLAHSGVADAQVAGVAAEQSPANAMSDDIRQCLDQSVPLGLFRQELDWQREQAWQRFQVNAELMRERITLLTRIACYAMVGWLIILLYSPIFSLALTGGRLP